MSLVTKNPLLRISQIFLAVFIVVMFVAVATRPTYGQHTGPVNVPRDLSNPSIHEGMVQLTAGYKTDISPLLGQLPASYQWVASIMSALGSMYKAVDPTWLSYKTGQEIAMYHSNVKSNATAERLYAGFKKIGGKDVTDIARLGQVCGKKPGDPYWVAYWRPGNVEYPPAYQNWYHPYDCYCRCGEMIACPIKDYAGEMNWNIVGGGTATHHILCEECFGYAAHIRKHDYYVGKDIADHAGYPVDSPSDRGYLECLHQSVESYGASMTGGTPNNQTLFGI